MAIAILYFCLLWLCQIFSWPKCDGAISHLPGPPRALTGNGATPIYGHTQLFMNKAGDMANEFDSKQLKIKWLCPIPN